MAVSSSTESSLAILPMSFDDERSTVVIQYVNAFPYGSAAVL